MKRSFNTKESYYLLNRGVDKRKVFIEKSDYIRFIHNLYEFNNTKPAVQFSRIYFEKESKKGKNVGSRVSNTKISSINIKKLKGKESTITEKSEKRNLLVNLHAFVLMPNYHHLLVEQLTDGGISLFMRKIHTGYTNAFNSKHKRKGHLFQGPFKDTYVEDDIRLGFLICYLHSSPLNILMPGWKSKKLDNLEIKKALKFLEKYHWSSHLDYLGIRNLPSLMSRKFLLEFFDGTEGYKDFFVNWLEQYRKNLQYIKDFIIV